MELLSGIRLGVVSCLLVLLIAMVAACEPSVTLPPPTPPPPPAGENRPPAIVSLVDELPTVLLFGSTKIKCTAYDPDGDPLTFTWSATGGNFSEAGPTVIWTAPGVSGTYKITVTVLDDKGGSAEGSLTVSVVANRPPVISSLVADPLLVPPGKTSKIVCLAFDPDGDELTYSWGAVETTIVGVGSQVVWVAPYQSGEYVVSVTVSDGKGGTAAANIILKVISPEKTITLNLVKGESGAIYWDGFVTDSLIVGDDSNNRGVRAYFSFDIIPLVRTKIVSANLTFLTKEMRGAPFISLGELHLERVDYGASPLGRANFEIAGSPLIKFFGTLPVEVDVTSQVDYLIKRANPRFQVRARFDRVTDANYGNDYILFNDAILTIIYIEE